MANDLNHGFAQFEREDTKAIKGAAVLMMMFHHLAAFPDRFPLGFEGFSAVGAQYIQEFAFAAKICVALFFFLGGYGLYIRFRDSNFSVTGTILNLYKAYWKVFAIFIPIAYLFFVRRGEAINPMAATYAFARTRDYITVTISDFTAWSCTLNGEWWFLKSYICVIPLGYLFCQATKRNSNFWTDIFWVFGIDILISNIFPVLSKYLQGNFYSENFLLLNRRASSFFAGIVFAKYDGICKLKQMLRKIPLCLPVCCIALAALAFCNVYVTGDDASDILYCAAFIPALSVVFDKITLLKKAAIYLGKHSTNIWLIHTFFCYYFLEFTKIVYCTQNVWIDMAILTALTLVSSVLVEGFWKKVEWVVHKYSAGTLGKLK